MSTEDSDNSVRVCLGQEKRGYIIVIYSTLLSTMQPLKPCHADVLNVKTDEACLQMIVMFHAMWNDVYATVMNSFNI